MKQKIVPKMIMVTKKWAPKWWWFCASDAQDARPSNTTTHFHINLKVVFFPQTLSMILKWMNERGNEWKIFDAIKQWQSLINQKEKKFSENKENKIYDPSIYIINGTLYKHANRKELFILSVYTHMEKLMFSIKGHPTYRNGQFYVRNGKEIEHQRQQYIFNTLWTERLTSIFDIGLHNIIATSQAKLMDNNQNSVSHLHVMS